MTLRPGLAWLAFAAFTAACQPAAGGTLRAHWTSLDTALGSGDLEVPLKVTWCASRGRLMLLGVSGDTGMGILVRTVKLAPGLLSVFDTVVARSPGASLAFRLGNKSSLFTLSADSGAVALLSVEGGLAGRFVGWFSQPSKGPVLVTGSFSGVQPSPDSVRCESNAPSPPLAAPGPDSGVT